MAIGLIKDAAADALLTSMWVFCVSTLRASTFAIATFLGVKGNLVYLITTSLVATLVFTFSLIGTALGGASFNPATTATFYAAGFGKSLYSMAIRFPAQAAGAVAGALAIKEVMPAQYKHMIGGPSLKVDPTTGAIAEGVMTFCISLAVLIIFLRVPGGSAVKSWLIAMCTVTLVVLGSTYTGPSMNPANAFGWAYVNNKHNTWEQFYVYWIGPFIGSAIAATVYKIVFPPPAPKKQKKVQKEE